MINIQAINLLKGLEQSLDDYCELNDEGKAAFRMAITALELFGNAEQLPSAQPEIIRCEDCRWRKDQSGSTAWLPCRAIVTPSDFYCGRAERKENR